jgi:hypothetical protein
MTDLTFAELERIAAADSGRDYARERRETGEAMRLCDWLEELDKERAADDVEEVLSDWNDPLTGLPTLGRSPRFRSAEEREYMDWIASEQGARTRGTCIRTSRRGCAARGGRSDAQGQAQGRGATRGLDRRRPHRHP